MADTSIATESMTSSSSKFLPSGGSKGLPRTPGLLLSLKFDPRVAHTSIATAVSQKTTSSIRFNYAFIVYY